MFGKDVKSTSSFGLTHEWSTARSNLSRSALVVSIPSISFCWLQATRRWRCGISMRASVCEPSTLDSVESRKYFGQRSAYSQLVRVSRSSTMAMIKRNKSIVVKRGGNVTGARLFALQFVSRMQSLQAAQLVTWSFGASTRDNLSHDSTSNIRNVGFKLFTIRKLMERRRLTKRREGNKEWRKQRRL